MYDNRLECPGSSSIGHMWRLTRVSRHRDVGIWSYNRSTDGGGDGNLKDMAMGVSDQDSADGAALVDSNY